jgi:hypothetical protein
MKTGRSFDDLHFLMIFLAATLSEVLPHQKSLNLGRAKALPTFVECLLDKLFIRLSHLANSHIENPPVQNSINLIALLSTNVKSKSWTTHQQNDIIFKTSERKAPRKQPQDTLLP